MAKVRYIIIGGGQAGINCAENIRLNDDKGEITIIEREEEAFYYRAAMKYYLKGKFPKEKLIGRTEKHLKEQKIKKILSVVKGIDKENKQVTLQSGDHLQYDRLLIATGANAFKFKFPGNDLDNVCVMRTLKDTEKIMNLAEKYSNGRSIIVGFGVLGLELAEALSTHTDIEVHLLGNEEYIAPRLCDKTSAQNIKQMFEDNGVKIHFSSKLIKIEKITKKSENGVSEDKLQVFFEEKVGDKIKSSHIDCDFVTLCIGVRADVSIAKSAGLKTNYGIVVDSNFKTSDPNIFAAGDCVELPSLGRPLQLWAPAGLMGKTAGINMVNSVRDTPLIEYNPGCIHAYTMFFGRGYHALGDYKVEEPDPASNLEILIRDEPELDLNKYPERRYDYFKMVLKDNKLIGVIGLGEIWAPVTLKKVIESGKPISEEYKRKILEKDFDYELLL